MHLFKQKTIQNYCERYVDAKQQLLAWAKTIEDVTWISPTDVKAFDSDVSFIGSNRLVFNIKGNKYRLIVEINYKKGWVFVIRFLTHADYDKIDVATISSEF